MNKKEEKGFKENADNCYELFVDLFQAFKNSKVFTEGSGNKHFAFDVMCGIAQFTSAVLKGLGKASVSEKVIYDFYTTELLPKSYEMSEELFDDVSACVIPFGEPTVS